MHKNLAPNKVIVEHNTLLVHIVEREKVIAGFGSARNAQAIIHDWRIAEDLILIVYIYITNPAITKPWRYRQSAIGLLLSHYLDILVSIK